MNRKLIFGLGPLLAVAALAVIPAVAQAKKPVKEKPIIWKGDCKKGGNGEIFEEKGITVTKCQTISWGKLSFAFEGPALALEVTCKKSDAGNVWNPVSGDGRDEIVLLDFYECQSKGPESCHTIAINALKLPWPTELFSEFGVTYDLITGIDLEVVCGTPPNDFAFTVTGNLTPKMVNGSPTVFEEFTGPAPGLTTSPISETVKVTGRDYNLGFEGERIKVA